MDETDTQAVQGQAPAQADTVDTSTSAASESVTNDTPEATQEQAQGANPEVTAEDTVQETLLAGKYKTPEELEQAYKSLESKFGQTANEKAELTRILNEAFTAPEPQGTDTADVFADEPAGNVEDPTTRKVSVIEFMIAHPEAAEHTENLQKVLATDPMISKIQGTDAKLEYALLRSQSMSQSQAVAEATKRGQEQATAKMAEKTTAQVENNTKSAPVDERAELKERMSSGSMEQRDAARREYIRKYLV